MCRQQMLLCRDLRHLFDELVRNGIISEGEFWKQRVHLLREAQGPTGSAKQRTGISNALLSRGTDAKGQQNKVRRLYSACAVMHQLAGTVARAAVLCGVVLSGSICGLQ